MPAAKPASPLLRRDHRLVSGLVGAFPCHEGSGSGIRDLSGRENHGTFQGGTTWSQGQAGSCLSFNGTSTYVTLANNSGIQPSAGARFSIAMWVKGGLQSDKRIICFGSSSSTNPIYDLGTDIAGTSAALHPYVRNDTSVTLLSALGSIPVFDNVWHHVCWSDNAGNAALYVDGRPDPTSFYYAWSGTFTTNQAALGCVWRSTLTFFYSGFLDTPLVFNRALTAIEAQLLYEDQWQMFRRRQQLLVAPTVEPPPTVTAWPAAMLGHL
jgi:hypothetical protein